MKMEEGELRYRGRKIDPADYSPKVHRKTARLKGRCRSCGAELEGEDAVPSPDPYAEEICGDDTPVVECDSCRRESARDI